MSNYCCRQKQFNDLFLRLRIEIVTYPTYLTLVGKFDMLFKRMYPKSIKVLFVEDKAIFLMEFCGVLNSFKRTGSRLGIFGRHRTEEYVNIVRIEGARKESFTFLRTNKQICT